MTEYSHVRNDTMEICAPLKVEDHVVQPFEFVSPPKWHLAHTTWFFETFCLAGTPRFNSEFPFLFNSYYESQGSHVQQSRRGTLSRPDLAEVHDYRQQVDVRMREAWTDQGEWQKILRLGLEHEMQHQELLLMDIKAILFEQPGHPTYRPDFQADRAQSPQPAGWNGFQGGLYDIGDQGSKFSYDNERPRHRVFLETFELRRGLTTNAEYLEFIRDRGYERPDLWLSDGWAWVQRSGARHPLYWLEGEREYSLSGVRPLSWFAPVAHVNYFEAEAFARWSGARLPTEAEWEVACSKEPQSQYWQWTQSAYLPYPGYAPFDGAFAEYNGKFMNGQMVLRGGCFATPVAHYRNTYRNFFYPEMRWQFSSIRLAR